MHSALRSQRGKERMTYHAERSVKTMRDMAELFERAQAHDQAKKLRTEANELEKAVTGRRTSFDYYGKRGDWMLFSELSSEAA